MLKNWKLCALVGMVAIMAFTVAFTACNDGGGGGGGGSGSVPAALVGEWAAKADPSEMVFKITSDGTFTMTNQSGGDFDKISVSGKTVELKYSGTTAGTFDYDIKNGEMTVTNVTGVVQILSMLSPFVKKGSNSGNGDPGSGSGLSALVGEWKKNGTTVFQVTSAGKFIMNGTTYDISVSGNTATLKFGGQNVGTFDYAISNGEMIMFNGTNIGVSVVALSPLTKPSGNIDTPIGEVGVTSITITREPTKTRYNIGEELDISGMVVTAAYSDGTSRTVTDYTCTCAYFGTAGQYTVIVLYNGRTATFIVTVLEPATLS